MKIGKMLNKLTDKASLGVALVGLALAPLTGGTSLVLAVQAVGTSKMIAYGIESIEDQFTKKDK